MSKKKGFFRTTIVLSLVLAIVPTIFANGQQETGTETTSVAPAEMSGKLVIWSFTNELGQMTELFTEKYPNVEVEFVEIPNQDEVYLNKVNQTLRSGSAVPDVFTGELSYVKQFIKAGYFADLSALGAEAHADDMIQYALDLGRGPEGEIRAMSWQATPGALYYRRSIAREVIGSDDPAEVSKYTSSLEGFYKLGEMIKEKFNGEKSLIAGYGDMYHFMSSFRGPWIQDNKLVIHDKMLEYMDMAKDMRDNGLENGAGTWTPPWFSSMADGSVMTYVLPTWGLHFVLKPGAEPEAHRGEKDFTGDWGLAVPPGPYFSGGTWAGVSENSSNKALAWEFVKFITTNEDFLKTWATQTGDFLGNEKMVNEIKDDFAEPFLGGQNHYQFFAGEASKIKVTNLGPYDFQIENAFNDAVSLYVAGEKTKAQAITDFKTAVLEILPDLNID